MTDTDLAAVLNRFDTEAVHDAFDTSRYRCRYHIWGEGLPLIIVHGLADRARSFAPLMAALGSKFRSIAYELPNGLDDDAAIAHYRHADYVSDLLALCEHLKLAHAVLLGSSFGSTIVLESLVEAAERFPLGILQGGFARRPLKRVERCLARLARFLPGRMKDMPCRARLTAKLDRPAFVAAPPGAYDFFCACSGHTPIRAAARRALILDKFDSRPRLPLIRQPVLMLGGNCDTIVPRSCEAEVESGLSNVRRIEFSDCGHYPQYSHPTEMADAIRTFVELEGRSRFPGGNGS